MTNQIAYRWEDRFRALPDEQSGGTMIVCSHPNHGVETFYLSLDQWQQNILMPLLEPYWVNNYTITLIPM